MVAEQSGFASSKNLSRLFREVLDMTPNQYRKLPQEAKNSLRMLKNITLLWGYEKRFVYDDKLVLTYNYKDGTETLTMQEIESVLSSNLTSMCPP